MVCKKSNHAADIELLMLEQVVIGKIIGSVLFVGSLLLLFKFVTS
ncbi:MAG: DUF2970 domain-containing protein [Betaproteobacteria bacterium]|nr:MAG: DUF2970 domain-containing protein [Betaproteobacteria bacterium]TDI81573.1 MAG: DUF2970 domain-containing protein [Betaproteobacteria bacterium]